MRKLEALRLSFSVALVLLSPRSLVIVINKCESSTGRSFMAEKVRGGCDQEQDCLSYVFQAIITNSRHTGSFICTRFVPHRAATREQDSGSC